MLNKIKKHWMLITPLLVALYPIMFLYYKNIGEVDFKDILVSIYVCGAFAIICVTFSYLFMRSSEKTAVLASMVMIIITNYVFVEKIVRKFNYRIRYWHLVPILFVFIVLIACQMKKATKHSFFYGLCKVITFMFAGLILMNFIFALGTISQKRMEHNSNSFAMLAKEEEKESLPNVYYLLFDEYSSFEFVSKYYNYDNSEFMNFLQNKGFAVSTDSYNDSYLTDTVMSNIHSLAYISDDNVPAKVRLENRKNSKIFELLKSRGYTTKSVETDNINSANTIPCDIPFNTSVKQKSNFEKYFWGQTIFYPLIENNMNEHFETISAAFNFIEDSEVNSGLFTYAHIVCPHEPFVVDQNGREISPKDSTNFEDKSIYLGQYIYVTNRIKQVINNILKQNPDAIIILQSDHSARFQFNDTLWEENQLDKKDMRNILNAVYYPNEYLLEIKGQSGLNTIRIVLSKICEIDLPVVEVPYHD